MDELFGVLRVAPGSDERDEPGGECVPLGLVFELLGPGAGLRWSINTGWMRRPVLTEQLTAGRQVRASHPGVDRRLESAFPQALPVRVFQPHHDDAADGRMVDGYAPLLFDALFDGGPPAVFAILRELYALEVA